MAADPVHRHAEQLYNEYKNQETIAYCDQVLAVDKLCQAALIFRGAASRKLNDHAAAIRDFTALLKLKPNNTFTLFALEQRGITYRKLGLLPEALKDLNGVLALNPNREFALLSRGLLRQQRGNYTGAEADLTKALEFFLLDPNTHPLTFIQLFEQRAAVRRILNRDRDALQDCLSALQKDATLVFVKELQEDLRENLDTGIPKKFIFNSAAPTAQYYVAPRYQFWTPTLENPAPSAPPAELGRSLFP